MQHYTTRKWFEEARKSRLLENSLEGYDIDEGIKVTLSIALKEAEYIIHYKESGGDDMQTKECLILISFIKKYKRGRSQS